MRAVGYLRASTQRQGRSGLGLDAQLHDVHNFCSSRGWELDQTFKEIESGKVRARPQLDAALARVRAIRGTLVVAKLDRLARNASFLLALRDSGVKFVAVDLPEANNLVVGIMAVIAQDEAERTSQRTIAALAAARRRGVKLGCPNGARALQTKAARLARTRAIHERMRQHAQTVAPILRELPDGLSDRAVAHALTERGIRAPRGGVVWTGTTVARVRALIEQRKETK